MPIKKQKDQRQRVPGKALVERVQRLLANTPDGQLSAQKLARLTGMEHRAFQRRAAELVACDHVSRTKVREQGGSFYRYSLSESQLEIARLEQRLASLRAGAVPVLSLEAPKATDRLAFLRTLKTQTVFGEHAMLELIITDYEMALGRARMAER